MQNEFIWCQWLYATPRHFVDQPGSAHDLLACSKPVRRSWGTLYTQYWRIVWNQHRALYMMRWLKKRSQPNEKLYYAWGFVRRLQIDHGNAFFGISHYHFRLRKKSENKKCKILDKRSFNVQRHRMSPTRPGINAKSFVFWTCLQVEYAKSR